MERKCQTVNCKYWICLCIVQVLQLFSVDLTLYVLNLSQRCNFDDKNSDVLAQFFHTCVSFLCKGNANFYVVL